MPMYDYICNECKETWEENLSMANSEKPCGEKCPHCGLEGKGANMTRYHFDNCKQRP